MSALLAALALLAFDPAATVAALRHPEGRTPAVRQLLQLDARALAAARAANVATVVAELVADGAVPFRERALGVRALAILGGDAGVPALTAQLSGTDGEGSALALESARALRQLGAVEALTGALDHPNPEVRAMAAAAGAGGRRLCALLAEDPWPMVRAAAAQGLSEHPAEAACVAPGLTDRPRVASAAARTAGGSGQRSLVEPLRALAGDAKAPVDARAEALVSLARLGTLGPARTVVATHLAKGGIEPLALAAVRALAHEPGAASTETLRTLLGSQLASVRLLAASALAERGDRESLASIKALRDDVNSGQRAELDRILARFGIAPADPEDPAATDPE